MDSHSTVSLFTGSMGLDLGLEAFGRLTGDIFGHSAGASFDIVSCVESDPFCQATIVRNLENGAIRSGGLQVFGDIKKIRSPQVVVDGVDDVDLIVGGPPCQTFSTVGRRTTVQDIRGTLLWDFQRFVRDLRPRFFLMENVRGLLSAAIQHRPIAQRGAGHPPLEPDERPGSVVRQLLSDFESIGYHVDVFEVNAVNYGAPQLRERVLLIGNKFNIVTSFPEPTHGPSDDKQGKILPGGLEPWGRLQDAIGALEEENPVVLDFSPRKKKYLAMVPPGGNWRSLPPEIQMESMGRAFYAKGGRSGWWRRLSWDLPCPCLLTLPNHASTSLCHPDEVRTLTAEEYRRIQEFPDGWEVQGEPADVYRQLGNAVPPRLGEVAAAVIAPALQESYDLEEAEAAWPSKRVYVNSHVRTRTWYKGGQAVVRDSVKVAEAP